MDAEHTQALELSRDDLLRMLDEGESVDLTRTSVVEAPWLNRGLGRRGPRDPSDRS